MKRVFIFIVFFFICGGFAIYGQYKITIDPDTILCQDGEAKITVATASTTLDLHCVARKGGGDFSEFKLVDGLSGKVQQATFTSPFPGEVEIHVLDGRNNRLGIVNLTVIAPILEIHTDDMYDSIDFRTKSMPLVVSVTDNRGNPVKNVKLVTKVTELVNKKHVPADVKVSPFIFRDGKFFARLSNLKETTYNITVYDMAHTESYDKAISPDILHPGTTLENMKIEFHY